MDIYMYISMYMSGEMGPAPGSIELFKGILRSR